jgi:predicted  nucleic acid-binding Zn-ribbon protein
MFKEFKDLYGYVKHVISLTHDVENSRERIVALESKVVELTRAVRYLVHELDRQRDELRHEREMAEHERRAAKKDRELLMLRIENALLREGRHLPPAGGSDANE